MFILNQRRKHPKDQRNRNSRVLVAFLLCKIIVEIMEDVTYGISMVETNIDWQKKEDPDSCVERLRALHSL